MLKSDVKYVDFVFLSNTIPELDARLLHVFAYRLETQAGTLYSTTSIKNGFLLSGSCVLDGELFVGPAFLDEPNGMKLKQQQEISGSYTLIHLTPSSVTFNTDSFGLSKFYLYEKGGHYIVGNNVMLLAAVIKEAQGTPPLNNVVLASQWVFPNTFGTQLNTEQLPLSGVRLLPSSNRLVCFSSELRTEVIAPRIETTVLSEQEYWQKIESGCEEILTSVNAILNSQEYDETVVNITGGRDSRMILPAMACLGRVDEVVFRTSFRSQREDDIATSLVGYVGGKYDDFANVRNVEVQPEAVIRKQLYFKQGLYHDIKFPKVGTDFQRRKSVRLIGGCGEIYRTFYTSILRKQFRDYHYAEKTGFMTWLKLLGKQKKSVDSVIHEFFNGFRLWDRFGVEPAIRDNAIDLLSAELARLPGGYIVA
ncbi:hypothetical protein [Idiomarina sp.]|uniref:hypothetical protein n=1 Tax=Idiomarina sp. TaxID=1874361 RepID=UPI00260A5C10|nr:hypothetical protein [Idiomarina sp.]